VPTFASLLPALLYVLALAMVVHLHALDRSVGLVADAVSDFGIGRVAGYFRLYGAVASVAAAALAWQLFVSDRPTFPPVVPLAMATMAAGRIGVTVFATDARGAASTRQGRLHRRFAAITFAAAGVTIATATPVIAAAGDALLADGLSVLRTLALAGLAAVVVTLPRACARLFGLAERMFLFASLFWFIGAGLWLAGIGR
jgi:hypothetical protein